MNYTIHYNNTTHSLDSLKITGLTIRRLNQGKDIAQITINTNQLSQAEIFTFGSTLHIQKNNTPYFTGVIIKTPIHSSALVDEQIYEVAGPWWHLENLIYQEPWSSGPSSKKINTSRVILGQNHDGSNLPANLAIQKILSFAIQADSPFTIGNINIPAEFPFEETKDISCAEAIQRILRWFPDSVLWFDYSTEIPSLNIARRNSLPIKSIPLTPETNLHNLSITPRHDLLIPGVILKYERLSKFADQYWNSIEEDKFPLDISDNTFKALVLTIEIDNHESAHFRQKVKTRAIQIDNTSWWQEHLPFLNDAKPDSILIENIHRKSTLPNEIIDGSISRWMGASVEEDTITALISYQTPRETVFKRKIQIRLNATNAKSKLYFKSTKSLTTESLPRDLAKNIFRSISELHFQGEFTVDAPNHSLLPLIGHQLNILNAKPEWSSMNALIQETTENLSNQTIRVRFGPPKHLGANDMIELLRMNRHRKASSSSYRRLPNFISLQKKNATDSTSHSKFQLKELGESAFERLEFHNSKSPDKKIIVDAASIVPDVTIELREEDVCENGILKKRLTLSSQPYSSPENSNE